MTQQSRIDRLEGPSVATIDHQGRSIAILPHTFIGSVESAFLTRTGASLTGWAVSRPADGSPVAPPRAFLLASGGKVIAAVEANRRRPDIAAEYGEAAAQSGFALSISIDMIPPPLQPNFIVYAFDGNSTASVLSIAKDHDKLSALNIATGSDFVRLIQSPSTRLPDPKTLAYAALHCMHRLPVDFPTRAAALCVIGYRLLNHEIDDPELQIIFEEESCTLLAEKPKIARGLFLRWHTSVRLIAGYLAFQAGRDREALEHFAAVSSFVADLTYWPQALTNLLLGLFITGYLRYRDGQVDVAIAEWSRGEGLFRFGSSIAEFQNFYAYGEVGNALRVVQECYIAIQVVRSGGPINNPSLAPPGMDIDLRRLPSPFAKLLEESKKRPHAGGLA
jgi:hypothetical protein